ncbi:uncharacterized protein F4822DRAFT_432578 [Hypoxylon trugodes]|uniref:uncharacterized protein n=1 Tax=Hypoxylon trugodes TaxID=326681 RepID=UPI002193D508|nr:uncharacterized protein F4822DRAFT_432578 [Hypoxylon trugodes]KAI1385723.1 hypothetical protein F4822DRAFT_432578 [Hypoxylon trugodes]
MDAIIEGADFNCVVAPSILSFNNHDLNEYFAHTEFLHNVLVHSESGVIHHLRTNPSSLYECTPNGLSSLHLAVTWPKGLSILIEYAGETIDSLINRKNRGEYTALEFALELEQLESIRILLDAGASVENDIFCYHFRGVPPVIDKQMIACMVVDPLVSQRKALLKLALRSLHLKRSSDLA